MSGLALAQKQNFQDRLSRITEGGDNCMGQVHVGPREEVRARDSKAAKKQLGKRARKAKRRGSPVATFFLLPVAVAVGAASLFVGRVASYTYFTADAPYSFSLAGVDASMFADVGIAAVLAMVLSWALRLTFGLRRLAVLAGFVAMMTGEAVLMQHFPDIFTNFYPESYVAGVIANPPTFL
jgi:hypothetical protein